MNFKSLCRCFFFLGTSVFSQCREASSFLDFQPPEAETLAFSANKEALVEEDTLALIVLPTMEITSSRRPREKWESLVRRSFGPDPIKIFQNGGFIKFGAGDLEIGLSRHIDIIPDSPMINTTKPRVMQFDLLKIKW